MASLRSLLSRTNVEMDKSQLEAFSAEIGEVIRALDRPGLNANFRTDLIKIISTSIDLAKTLSNPSFTVDEVLQNLSFLSARVAMIQDFIANNRPRTVGWGLVHKITGQVAPMIYTDKAEGERYADQLRNMGMLPPDVELRRVEVVSSSVQAPTAPIIAATPPPPHPPQMAAEDDQAADVATLPEALSSDLPSILRQLEKEQLDSQPITAKPLTGSSSNDPNFPQHPLGSDGRPDTPAPSDTPRG